MSGHSKWSQIKRQKGAADIKRGAVFSKLSNAIIIAAKSGGDPNSNFSLKMAIEKARSANMPKENIDRAIRRGTGEIAGAKIEEVIYEAIGPQNIGIIIEAVTDNRNRTNSEVKNTLSKFGAKLVGSGAVSYQFKKMGKIVVSIGDKNLEDLELEIIDAGAEDFTEHGEDIAVYTKASDLETVKRNLESQDLGIKEAGLSYEPGNIIEIADTVVANKIINLMTALDELDDVTTVYSNFDIKE